MAPAQPQTVIVTGAAGFIGSCVVRRWLRAGGMTLVGVDKLTYAGNLASLEGFAGNAGFRFELADICDAAAMARVLHEHAPDAILNLAAESHVDRSIHGARDFVDSNIVGTYTLLEAARSYWQGLAAERRARFRFHHVSTDEVFGSLPPDGASAETDAYRPNSPYSASKAAADHLVRAWQQTYGLPTLISRSSNNYGPCQHPEKLIPLMTLNALAGKPLPIYGDGSQVRDWLHVDDHADALRAVLERGRPGESYNVGGGNLRSNSEVVQSLCAILDELQPAGAPHARLVEPVADRPGHDRRYAMDCGKIAAELGWRPAIPFAAGLAATVRWYRDNTYWVQGAAHSAHREWLALNYAGRARQPGHRP